MMTVRKADDRGQFNHGWLQTSHTFSFGQYHDPAHMSFRSLRVMNEDHVAPGHGFGMHPHRDMEIVTCVLSGALEHRDSMGNGEVLRPGEMQRMSAGTGIMHSEFNPSPTEPVHLYQIWLLPRERGIEPSYEQKAFAPAEQQNRWQIVASPDGDDGALTINQDARIALSRLDKGAEAPHAFEPGRHGWLQVMAGQVQVGPHTLTPGDGLAISDEPGLLVKAESDAQVMLFDLA